MAGKVSGGANGGNNAILHCQKDIPAHLGAAAVDKASRHYETCSAHNFEKDLMCMLLKGNTENKEMLILQEKIR